MDRADWTELSFPVNRLGPHFAEAYARIRHGTEWLKRSALVGGCGAPPAPGKRCAYVVTGTGPIAFITLSHPRTVDVE